MKNIGVNEQDSPNNVIIILANPRSGSTWLFDAIRSHPAVDMLIKGNIYRDLDLIGRRYPRDLVPNNRKHINVEVVPNTDKWVDVPVFSIPEDEYKIPGVILQKRYAIEKIHPHYYRFNSDPFITKINDYTDNLRTLKMIYLVREPKGSLVSFLNYQKRNPKWNSDKKPADVIMHMNMTYQNILGVAEHRNGLIVDYGKLRQDFDNTLSLVFEFLWPGTAQLDSDRNLLVNRIKTETDWEKRKSKRPFLGNQIGSISGNNSGYNQFFEKYPDEISKCNSYYEKLISLNSK